MSKTPEIYSKFGGLSEYLNFIKVETNIKVFSCCEDRVTIADLIILLQRIVLQDIG